MQRDGDTVVLQTVLFQFVCGPCYTKYATLNMLLQAQLAALSCIFVLYMEIDTRWYLQEITHARWGH